MNEKKGLSRRAFVASVAAGAAVLAGGGSARAAAKTTAKKAAAKKGGTPAPSAAVRAEIAKQKKQTADLVKSLRDYKLPPASGEVGFVFHPMRPGRKGGDE